MVLNRASREKGRMLRMLGIQIICMMKAPKMKVQVLQVGVEGVEGVEWLRGLLPASNGNHSSTLTP